MHREVHDHARRAGRWLRGEYLLHRLHAELRELAALLLEAYRLGQKLLAHESPRGVGYGPVMEL